MSSSSSTTAIGHLQSSFRSCSSFCCLPYRFSSARGFYITESKWALFFWKLNAVVCFLFAAFAVTRMVQLNLSSDVPTALQLYMILIAPVHCIAFLVFQVPTLLSRHDFVKLACQTEEFLSKGKHYKWVIIGSSSKLKARNFKYQGRTHSEETDRILVGLLRFIYYGCTANAILLPLLGILRPDSPEMITSVFYSTDPCYKHIVRFLATLLFIWHDITAHKGTIALVSLYVTSFTWTQELLISMR